MLLEELVEAIKSIAIQNGVAPEQSPLLDSTTLIELVLPRVLSVVATDVCKDEQQVQALRANHSIDFVDGVAELPTTIKEEFIESAYFYGASASTNSATLASYKRDFIDYGQGGSNIVPTFSTQNGNIYYRTAGAAASAYSGTLLMNAITLPSMPISSTAEVILKANILQQVITLTASIITGQVPLARIGLDYSQLASEGKLA